MNERLKILREHLKISQETLGEKINVTRSHISSIEKGKRALTDRVITDICREFNVNEDWLRNGTGEMFIKTSNELVDQIVEKYNFTNAEKQALEAYLQLSNDDRAKISELIRNIFGGFFKIDNSIADTKEETFEERKQRELDAYALELDAQEKGEISSVSEKPKGA